MATMNSNWLRAAITDDNLVAELLLSLNRPRPTRRFKPPLPHPPLDWGLRQPRSMSFASLKKEREVTRCSPTTPLSWTASGSSSTSDSCEESSRPLDRLLFAARFKVNATNDATKSVSASKKLRRKKTFAELKEEETTLLKERTHLREELESLRMKFEEYISSNQNMKRIKLDSHVLKPVPTINERKSLDADSNAMKKLKSEEVSTGKPSIFVLPDLNMTPEENCPPESVVEMN